MLDTCVKTAVSIRDFFFNLFWRSIHTNVFVRKGSVADRLFESMAPHDSASYAAFLCGKAQFGDVDAAYRLYQEASDANFGLPTEAFNKLIAGAAILKEGHELRWQFVEVSLECYDTNRSSAGNTFIALLISFHLY